LYQNFVYISLLWHVGYMSHPFHAPCFNILYNIRWMQIIKKRLHWFILYVGNYDKSLFKVATFSFM
jgi:hypothetical protein